jgi:hypothetical protein
VTEATADDATTAIEFIRGVDGGLVSVTGDAAYDTIAFYETAAALGATVVVPPNKTARVSRRGPRSSARDGTITKMKKVAAVGGSRRLATIGRPGWRTPSFGTNRSSVVVFARALQAGESPRR